MKRLVVTADDFGRAVEVNEAIEEAFTRGVVTATSLMVAEPMAAEAVERAKRLQGLRVGLHLVLVDGRPVLAPERVPDLVDSQGLFRQSLLRASIAFLLSPAVRRQLAMEIEAQFDAFARTGLALDHVNAHRHVHLHPVVAHLLLRIGARHGAKAMRVPVEPAPVLAAVEAGSKARAPGVGTWAQLLRRRFAAAGMTTPDQVFGLAWSGAMTSPRLAGLIAHLPEGLSEIYLHPAKTARFAGAAPGYRYEEELAAVTDPAVIEAARESGAQRGGFSDFL
jgi:hopanoid biosynthesis associated protein HpnK